MIHSPLTNPGDVIRLSQGSGTIIAILHWAALLLLLICVTAWGRWAGRRGLAIAASAAVTSIAACGFFWRRAEIPIDWITVMQHGFERHAIFQLYTEGVHAGESFHYLVRAAAMGDAPTLHDVVRLNLFLSAVNAVVFLAVAIRLAGFGWAWPWTLAFSLNPAMLLASFSELPAHVLALYFLAGVIGWAVLTDDRPQPRAIRAAAFLLCAILTVLAALTRMEVALIGALALTLYSAPLVIGAGRWDALVRWMRDVLSRAVAWLGDRPAAVAALCILGVIIGYTGIPNLVGRSQLAAVYPFDVTAFSLYAYLPTLMLPVGVSIGIFFGTVDSIRRFRAFGGLALSLLMIVRMYFTSWGEYYEMGRYLSSVLAAVFLLGPAGHAAFVKLAKGWNLRTARAAKIVYLMTWFTLPLPGVVAYYERPDYHWERGFSQLLLDRDAQREVRYLLTLTERDPDCLFVGRIILDEGGGNPIVDTRHGYIAFGGPVRQPFVVPETGTRLHDFISGHAKAGSCVRLYYGGDCNQTFTDDCRDFVAGHRLLEEQRSTSRQYGDKPENGHSRAELVLATYAWP